jgi:hypothetical protein
MAHNYGAVRHLAEEASSTSSSDTLQKRDMEQWGQWLLSLGKDAQLLSHTREYRAFVQAAQCLERANRHIQIWHRNEDQINAEEGEQEQLDVRHCLSSQNLSFLQHLASDDILIRVFDFLECRSLVHASATCTRCWELAHRNARVRTQDIGRERQLSNIMQVLRAKEQIDGVYAFDNHRDSHVRIPTLLLSRRVRVSDAGDPEYNGVYYCTGSNGNGFLFTKPRYPLQRVHRRRRRSTATSVSSTSSTNSLPDEHFLDSATTRVGNEAAQLGQPLRCIIAKRFSNEVRNIVIGGV